MSADMLVVYLGARFSLGPSPTDAELEALEARTDARILAARRARLQHFWGRTHDGGECFLLVGRELGRFGVEGAHQLAVPASQLEALTGQVLQTLRQVGIAVAPGLHVQFIADN